MTKKIALYYLIAQYGEKEWWQDQYYSRQLDRIKKSNLYDNIDFIEIHVTNGREMLPSIPDKTKSIHFHDDTVEAMNNVMKSVHAFSLDNLDYKILFLHSDGVSHCNRESLNPKLSHLDFAEYCVVDLWEDCVNLLDFYQTVGFNYIPQAMFLNTKPFHAPHYRSGIWWSTSEYISTLNIKYLEQNVEWRRFLGELWIGTNNPRFFCIEYTLSDKTNYMTNFYREETQYDKDCIKNKLSKHYSLVVDFPQTIFDFIKSAKENSHEDAYLFENYTRKIGW